MSVTTTTRMPKTGFPPASKLLSKYEHERAYKQHQQKMQEMRHGLDNSNPKEYPHLAVRMKRLQKEEERQLVVDQENELLVRKMRKIMTRKGRLDNWNHEYEPRNNLHAAYRERQQEQIAVENMGMAKRLEKVGPVYRVSRWEEDYQRHEEILERRAEETKDYEESLTPRGRSKRTAKTRQKPHKASRAAKKPTTEDKYEDDFESDEEDSTQKSETKENNRISEGDQKDGSQNGENRRKEAQNDDDSSLPHIKKEEESSSEKAESRRNSKTSPQQSKVSKLPAVNQPKKDTLDEKFSVYKDKKYENKIKAKTKQKKALAASSKAKRQTPEKNETSEKTEDVEDHPVVEQEEGEVRESSSRGGNQAEDSRPEDPETGESGKVSLEENHGETPPDGQEDLQPETSQESPEVQEISAESDPPTTEASVKSDDQKNTAGSEATTEKKSAEQDSVQSVPSSAKSRQTTCVVNQGEGGTSLADSDAKLLFRVCKQLEKPDDIVIKTLVRRSYNQRMQTKTKFRDLYDLDLVSELRQGLGEPWFPLISALLTENEASDISAVHTALQTGDVSAVVETLSTRSSASLSSLADGYRKEYAISLESEVSEKTTDPVRLLLLSLIKGGRADSSDVNEDEAEKDARELYESGEGRWTSDTGKFIRLIQQKNSAQFRVTLNMFKQIAGGKDIMVSIKQDCADHPQYVDALSTFINCSKGPQMYFSEKLHGCKKLDDPGFVNILVSRAEVDMPGTRKSYKKKYGRELAEDVGSKGPHPTLRVLLELVNRPAPGQARSKPGQPSKKTTNAPGGQPKKTVTRKMEKKDDAASTKPSPLDKPGKRVLAEAKLKREVEERAKSKQAAPKREKTKVDKEASEPMSSDGTVKPAGDFSADKDAERLYKAMDGLGTNEEEIMGILPRRSNSQRQSIRQAYSKKYDRDLLEDLKSELSGDFEELILALMMTPVQYDAYCVHDAVRGLGTDEAMLVGVLSTRSSEEIQAVKEQYESAYKSDMKKDTSGDTSNAFKLMLVSLMNGERRETETVDEGLAEELAQKLCKEDKSLYVDDGTLLTLLTTHSRAQIRATFEKYKQIAGHDVYEGIRMAMRGDDEDGYLALAKAADDVIEFYAGRLHRSLTRDVGSDDKMLTRIIVSRSEIDLGVIQSKYKDLYGKSLQESVERECDGDFKKTLLAILGDKETSLEIGPETPPSAEPGQEASVDDGKQEEQAESDTVANRHQVQTQDAVLEVQTLSTSPATDTTATGADRPPEGDADKPGRPQHENKTHSDATDSAAETSPKKTSGVTFEPGRDCELLFSLLNDKEVDEKKIFEVLVARTHKQRLQLRMRYQILYRQDLVRELRNNLPPSLEIAIGALTLEAVEYDTLCIHQAVSGIAVDDRTLVTILVSRDPVHLKAVKIKFWQVYGKDLIDYLRRITNSELGELLLLLSCLPEGRLLDGEGRSQAPEGRSQAAEGRSLEEAAEGRSQEADDQLVEAANRLARKLSAGEKSYLDVFHKKSADYIHKVFQKYAEITGKDISESFQRHKAGEVRSALMAFADYLKDPFLFYVHQLKAALIDPGVDGIILIHIVVCRAETALGEIKRRYFAEYGVSLEEDIATRCTADHGRVLLAVLRSVL